MRHIIFTCVKKRKKKKRFNVPNFTLLKEKKKLKCQCPHLPRLRDFLVPRPSVRSSSMCSCPRAWCCLCRRARTSSARSLCRPRGAASRMTATKNLRTLPWLTFATRARSARARGPPSTQTSALSSCTAFSSLFFLA